MKVDILCVGVNHETWFRGTRDERQVSVLNCLDRAQHLGLKLKNTFDYNPAPDEVAELFLEKLDGLPLTIAVSEIRAANAGRLTMRGKIDRGTLPSDVLVNGSKPVVTPSKPAVK